MCVGQSEVVVWCGERVVCWPRCAAVVVSAVDRVWVWLQEALEAAERLRREHDHSFGGSWGLNGPAADAGTSATLTALLETKDARILSLEREVALLEGEVAMARESGGAGLGGGLLGGGSRWGSRASLVTPPPTDDSRLLQVLQERERKAKSQVSCGLLGGDVTRGRHPTLCLSSHVCWDAAPSQKIIY